MGTDWKAAALNLQGGKVHSVISAPGSADAVTQDLTGAQPPIQVTEYKPTTGQQLRSRMGPPPPLEVGPLRKTTDILPYTILPAQRFFGVKTLPQKVT